MFVETTVTLEPWVRMSLEVFTYLHSLSICVVLYRTGRSPVQGTLLISVNGAVKRGE
jgi:hypothetical protein